MYAKQSLHVRDRLDRKKYRFISKQRICFQERTEYQW